MVHWAKSQSIESLKKMSENIERSMRFVLFIAVYLIGATISTGCKVVDEEVTINFNTYATSFDVIVTNHNKADIVLLADASISPMFMHSYSYRDCEENVVHVINNSDW